ncbi:MAG: hypothetical protein H6878_08840 [Rhodobiaceae bacterium]|nr:hypothetical protein [Rhodobiaceae bacterium]
MMFAFSQDWTNRSRDAECGLFGVDAMNSVAALACLPLTAAVTTTAAMATGGFAVMLGWQAVMLRSLEGSPFMSAYAHGGGRGKAADVARQPVAEKRAVEAPQAALPASDTVARPSGLEAPRGQADDLKRISGVGPKLEIVLNDLGIYHFDQIAAWSAGEVEWIDDYLKFKGRIERDKWIAQARRLMESVTE